MPGKARKPSRRSRGEGGLYQRKSDGLWVGTVDVGYDAAGNRIRRTVTSKTYTAAFDKLTDLKRNLEDHGAAPDATTTVERWLTYWLEEIAAPLVKPRTLQGYRTTVTQHLIPHVGRKRLDQLRQQHVRELHRALHAAGLASATRLKAHRVLAKALTDAQREGKVNRNVASLVPAPSKFAETARTPLTADQAKTLLLSLVKADDPLASRWAAALLIGARQGECLGLTWDRVDLHHGVVDLSWQLQRLGFRHGCAGYESRPEFYTCGRVRAGSCPRRVLDVPAGFAHRQLEGGLCLTSPKGRPRVVPLPAPMLAFLLQHRERTSPSPSPDELVWTRPDGRPLDPSRDNAAWHAALAAAGLPTDVDLHSARHTTATFLLDLGIDALVVRQILGHSDVVTTRGYQHVSLVMARQAMDELGDLLAIEGQT